MRVRFSFLEEDRLKKLIIEARVNEYAPRTRNRNVPWSVAEIAENAAACRKAGASVVHFHSRKADGSPEHSYESYRDTLKAIRATSDILIHPTLGYVTLNAPAHERLSHIRRMVEEGVPPDIAPMDMGSTNVSVIDESGKYIPDQEERVYQNSTATLHYFADHIRKYKLKPYLQIWNISFMREMEQFFKVGWLDAPVFAEFVCTDNHCIGGHPGTAKGLQALIDFLPPNVPVEWTVCNYGGNLLPLVAQAVSQGGHISIGLGDYHYNELGEPTNAELVSRVVQIAREFGREVATPAEAKQILGIH
jgi:3-keto-5-aminohexanoate cleavage enzyme